MALQSPVAVLFVLCNAACPRKRYSQGPPVPNVICKFPATEMPALCHPYGNSSVSIQEGTYSLVPIVTEHKSAFLGASSPSLTNKQNRGHQVFSPQVQDLERDPAAGSQL